MQEHFRKGRWARHVSSASSAHDTIMSALHAFVAFLAVMHFR